MIYGVDYFGFVYLWRDRHRKASYIGSHMGSMTDGYTGSSTRFLRAINRRPVDFRRKILHVLRTNDRKTLLREEERWLTMIKPELLQRSYYNVKRRGTGGYVTEGYNVEERARYIEHLKNRPGKSAGHYAARPCFCAGLSYPTMSDAVKALGWSPQRRLNSRKHKDFYWVDEGEPSDREITDRLTQRKIAQQRSIDAMQKKNRSLSREVTHQRAIDRWKRTTNRAWKLPLASRKGRSVNVDNQVFANLRHASDVLKVSVYEIRKRIKSSDWPTWQDT